MSFRTIVLTTLAMLGACAPLRAERPLFFPADQTGPAPLQEGLWVQVGADCSEQSARMVPPPLKCAPASLSRLEDGAWLYQYTDEAARAAQAESTKAPTAWRVILAPAPEARSDAAPGLPFIIEYAPHETGDGPHYGVLIPLGELPAREALLETEIECGRLDGESIEGLEVTRNDSGDIVDCVARTQASVRAAVRALLAQRAEAGPDKNARRLLYVAPEVR